MNGLYLCFIRLNTSLSPGKLFGGELVDSILKSSFMGSYNRVAYCIISSKISYSCVIPNVKFFIYTQLIHYPWFIGPVSLLMIVVVDAY